MSHNTRQTKQETDESVFEALYQYMMHPLSSLRRSSVFAATATTSTSTTSAPKPLDLSPSPALPYPAQLLQGALLSLIVEFGEIARDLDRLGRGPSGDFLERFSPMWSDAQTAAFTQTINRLGTWGQ